MAEIDPTDHALATIASILDSREPPRPQPARQETVPAVIETAAEPAQEPAADLPPPDEIPAAPEAAAAPAPTPPPVETHPEPEPEPEPPFTMPADAHGYCKVGPGPLASIRFKWTVRRDEHGQHFVDETVGEDRAPLVTGPFSKEMAVDLVNERERAARQQFERLRAEMSSGSDTAELLRLGGR